MIVRAISPRRVLAPADPSSGWFVSPILAKSRPCGRPVWDGPDRGSHLAATACGDRENRVTVLSNSSGSPWVLSSRLAATTWLPLGPPGGHLAMDGHLATANRGTLNPRPITLAGRTETLRKALDSAPRSATPSNFPGLPGIETLRHRYQEALRTTRATPLRMTVRAVIPPSSPEVAALAGTDSREFDGLPETLPLARQSRKVPSGARTTSLRTLAGRTAP